MQWNLHANYYVYMQTQACRVVYGYYIGWPQTVISSLVPLMRNQMKRNDTETQPHKWLHVIKYLYHDLTMKISFWCAKRSFLAQGLIRQRDDKIDSGRIFFFSIFFLFKWLQSITIDQTVLIEGWSGNNEFHAVFDEFLRFMAIKKMGYG